MLFFNAMKLFAFFIIYIDSSACVRAFCMENMEGKFQGVKKGKESTHQRSLGELSFSTQ